MTMLLTAYIIPAIPLLLHGVASVFRFREGRHAAGVFTLLCGIGFSSVMVAIAAINGLYI